MLELYKNRDKILAICVDYNGMSFAINADFRVILKIFALLKDSKIPYQLKISKLREYFFVETLEFDINTTLEIFKKFISSDCFEYYEKDTDENEAQFDYIFDGEEIFSSFLHTYNINLLHIDFLHWYEFRILLKDLPRESAFKRKIELRFLDLSAYSRDSKIYDEMSKAKQRVQLPIEYTEEELREIQEFDDCWGKF